MNTMKKNSLGGKIVEFAKETTIHGVPKVAANKIHPLERLFWIVIIVGAISGAIALSLENLGRYYANPTVVSLKKDYRNWFNPFPSATACFIRKSDEIAVDEYIINTWGVNDSHPKYDYYMEFVESVAHLSFHTLDKLEQYKDNADLIGIDFMDLSYKVHPILSGTLITFDSTRKSDWSLVITEMGICFSMNTKVAKFFKYSSSEEAVSEAVNGTDDAVDNSILKCHYLNGLCYARYDSDPDAPLKVYVHSFLDIAHETSEVPLDAKESQELEINFQMHETTSDNSLRNLSPSQRRCRFDDEPLNEDLPAYSTSICYISCRYRLIMKLCGCKPYFYYNFPGKLCDLTGLLCVAKHVEEITMPPLKLGCECPQPCESVTYLPQVPKITVWEYGYFEQRITFRWGLIPPTTKYHRNVLFGFEDLVVSIGGTLALFLGVSFITAIEIAFFLIDIIIYLLCLKRREDTPEKQTYNKRKLHNMKNEIENNLATKPHESLDYARYRTEKRSIQMYLDVGALKRANEIKFKYK